MSIDVQQVKVVCRFCVVTGGAIAAILWLATSHVEAARWDRCLMALDHVEEAAMHGLDVAQYSDALYNACDGLGM